MDFGWEHVTAIMSVSGILIAAIIKFVPTRHICIQESRIQDVKDRVNRLEEKIDRKLDQIYDILIKGEL